MSQVNNFKIIVMIFSPLSDTTCGIISDIGPSNAAIAFKILHQDAADEYVI